MQYEVEQKFPVGDLAGLEARLTSLGATIHESVRQVDRYFAHPSRDFAATDEALRIRRVGERNFVTYKGPKIDTATKTRREIERPIEPGAAGAAALAELLEALGFRAVAQVRKQRRRAVIPWQGRQVEGALDEVDTLGTFVELELTADEQQLPAAQAAIRSLADHLGLSGSQRRSYLELLLERQQGQG